MASLNNRPRFALATRSGAHLVLGADCGARIEVFVLADDIVRVLVLPDGTLRAPRTWAIAPGLEDTALEGRDRRDLGGFEATPYTLAEHERGIVLETGSVRLTVEYDGGFCSWEVRQAGAWHAVLRDRRTQAYNFGWWDARVYHYVERERGEIYVGLGERAGALNRAGQCYEMRNIDAMGYDARTTDPLYKHIPFYVTWRPETSTGYGLFYDTLADCRFDMGRELDNYHGHYRHFVAEHGDLDYYFIASADTPLAAVRRFTWLTGRPAWTPKWGLGYSGSTMSYTDADDAQSRMAEFLERCEAHDILCDSFHLSSGYTSIGPKRYVFNWNREKFPDIDGFVDGYLRSGVRLCANIKPCLLQDHPAFEEVERAGLLIRAADGTPAWVQFWDEVGAYLDFTNPAAYDWWKARVKGSLLAYGIAATWNDNNEFEIWTPNAIAQGFGTPFAAQQAKPLQTLLMMRASRDAQREHAPGKRPFLVSRSGAVGMQRYVQTWSGDNFTSWETLRFNLKMGLGLAMSGVSNSGHDIGGFSGPAPEPELFARWVAFGVFLPRFSIHSWNDDGTVNEPWMYPELTRLVADLIKLRYRLIPYLYELLWQSHACYEPVLRPMFAEFPHDPACLADGDDMMLGSSMLVAPVVEPGQTTRDVYLPAGARWASYWSGEVFEGGQTVRLPAPMECPVFLIREGGCVPLNVAEQHFARAADERAFMAVPYAGDGELSGHCIEDDGESEAGRAGEPGRWNLSIRSTPARLTVSIARAGRMPAARAAQAAVTLMIPAADTREVTCAGAEVVGDVLSAGWRCLTVRVI
ncbi:glycoside hydrolase family 31 protein [Burkholderia glumae]|uniref:glycoside hydrolase family 31 protein n=1 Tax=Burkholderia glumae TaxID=337 RepID=UPI000F5D8643|nr:glycoside hydrolase family 31 protein [Burkholderia glumae]MCQ0032634.1 glycoside hydrolase family 31 protein [Burkholderia glumae]MCQ0037686.1 glycoside hydrolase family 31 protein [Burkholderia glumae]QJW80941.1 glycoside hydrolase family 31 protein [Burkholderia glumae]RQZ68520.1 glycoside hydrolase family 31 protein [Burkholderia glumae]UVS83831.1 glycoside hydrolase family 31 protein [Burkholderia glumae]